MSSEDSPCYLVAQFLRANNYHETLEVFLREAGLPPDTGQNGDLTIEKILNEKKVFDLTVRFERIGIEGDDNKWTQPAPSSPTPLSAIPIPSNVLHVSLHTGRHPANGASDSTPYLLSTTADRRLILLEAKSGCFEVIQSVTDLHDSPILSCATIRQQYLVSSSMSGQVVLYNLTTSTVLEKRRDHKKYVVKVAVWDDDEGTWVVTAGWDAKVFLYRVRSPATDELVGSNHMQLGNPVASLTLPTNPEDVIFIRHLDSETPILLVSRKDSTCLYYYALPTSGAAPTDSRPRIFTLLGTQNLAPHSNAWIAFSPSALAISPRDPSILAVATSAVPHMKLIIVRLLLPPIDSDRNEVPAPGTQGAQARRLLAIQDREDAAIQSNTNTLAPQTDYSTPQVCWRPDGSGLWVNGDDGVIRGVEAKTGKVVATLRDGHEMGSKIRTIAGGWNHVNGKREECVVSGGFDRRLIVWGIKSDE